MVAYAKPKTEPDDIVAQMSPEPIEALFEDIFNHKVEVNEDFLLDVLMVAGGYMQEAGDAVGTEQPRRLCKNLCVCLESWICEKLGGDTQIIDDAIAARVRRILDGKHGGYE